MLLPLLSALALAASATETITPISHILRNRDLANGRNFCVVGKPVKITEKVGEVTGKHLFRGILSDGTGQLMIFAYGNFPRVSLGEAIEVCGRFSKFYLSKGNNGYHNQLEAAAILKGKLIASGAVEIGETITAVSQRKASGPQAP